MNRFSEIVSIKLLQLYCYYTTSVNYDPDHCALWGCDNDWRFLPSVGIMKFFSRHNVFYGTVLLNHNKFKVTMSTKVFYNPFVQGYRHSQVAHLLYPLTVFVSQISFGVYRIHSFSFFSTTHS